MSTVVEKAFMNRVASIGCVVCMNSGNEGTPAVIHHLREEMGGAMRNSNFMVLPLCPYHHDDNAGGFHKNRKTWQMKHGTELELFGQVLEIVFSGLRLEGKFR